MLDGSGVKAMPGSIPTHLILVHYRKNKKIQVAQWGTPKIFLSTFYNWSFFQKWLFQLSIIVYEKYGSDKKRTFANKLVSI